MKGLINGHNVGSGGGEVKDGDGVDVDDVDGDDGDDDDDDVDGDGADGDGDDDDGAFDHDADDNVEVPGSMRQTLNSVASGADRRSMPVRDGEMAMLVIVMVIDTARAF